MVAHVHIVSASYMVVEEVGFLLPCWAISHHLLIIIKYYPWFPWNSNSFIKTCTLQLTVASFSPPLLPTSPLYYKNTQCHDTLKASGLQSKSFPVYFSVRRPWFLGIDRQINSLRIKTGLLDPVDCW